MELFTSQPKATIQAENKKFKHIYQILSSFFPQVYSAPTHLHLHPLLWPYYDYPAPAKGVTPVCFQHRQGFFPLANKKGLCHHTEKQKRSRQEDAYSERELRLGGIRYSNLEFEIFSALSACYAEIITKDRGGIMRIRVRDEKIIKAIKKLEGIDIVLKTVEDAKKAIRLILRKTEMSKSKDYEGLKDIAITQVVEHPTSAVEYHTYYEIEFLLTDDRFTEMEIALIKELQGMFEKL
jgi:hypothetical protein